MPIYTYKRNDNKTEPHQVDEGVKDIAPSDAPRACTGTLMRGDVELTAATPYAWKP